MDRAIHLLNDCGQFLRSSFLSFSAESMQGELKALLFWVEWEETKTIKTTTSKQNKRKTTHKHGRRALIMSKKSKKKTTK